MQNPMIIISFIWLTTYYSWLLLIYLSEWTHRSFLLWRILLLLLSCCGWPYYTSDVLMWCCARPKSLVLHSVLEGVLQNKRVIFTCIAVLLAHAMISCLNVLLNKLVAIVLLIIQKLLRYRTAYFSLLNRVLTKYYIIAIEELSIFHELVVFNFKSRSYHSFIVTLSDYLFILNHLLCVVIIIQSYWSCSIEKWLSLITHQSLTSYSPINQVLLFSFEFLLSICGFKLMHPNLNRHLLCKHFWFSREISHVLSCVGIEWLHIISST